MITGRILIAHGKRLIFIGPNPMTDGAVLTDPSQYTNWEQSFGHYYPLPFPFISRFGEAWAKKDEIKWTDEYIGIPEPEDPFKGISKIMGWDY